MVTTAVNKEVSKRSIEKHVKLIQYLLVHRIIKSATKVARMFKLSSQFKPAMIELNWAATQPDGSLKITTHSTDSHALGNRLYKQIKDSIKKQSLRASLLRVYKLGNFMDVQPWAIAEPLVKIGNAKLLANPSGDPKKNIYSWIGDAPTEDLVNLLMSEVKANSNYKAGSIRGKKDRISKTTNKTKKNPYSKDSNLGKVLDYVNNAGVIVSTGADEHYKNVGINRIQMLNCLGILGRANKITRLSHGKYQAKNAIPLTNPLVIQAKMNHRRGLLPNHATALRHLKREEQLQIEQLAVTQDKIKKYQKVIDAEKALSDATAALK